MSKVITTEIQPLRSWCVSEWDEI